MVYDAGTKNLVTYPNPIQEERIISKLLSFEDVPIPINKKLPPIPRKNGGTSKTHIRFNNKTYKLRMNKQKDRYIIVLGSKVFLKDIRRKYRYSD
jgi:hypothetical protein